MYVSVNLENMTFMHAHEHLSVVDSLMYIEGSQVSSAVEGTSRGGNFMMSFTDLELRTLYKNTTGEEMTVFARPAMREALRQLALTLPPTDVNVMELETQTGKVDEHDSNSSYRYVKGSMKPAKMQDLWHPPALRAIGAPALREQPAVITTRSDPAPWPVTTTSAPRQGTARDRIWAYASQKWEEAGKPTGRALLELRKRIMDDLEGEGYKRTSCSGELGRWQKATVG